MQFITYVLTLICLITVQQIAFARDATINIVNKNGTNEYFMAMKNGRVLWTRPTRLVFSEKFYDKSAGVTVLESLDELLAVDRFGVIKRHLKLGSNSDPRILFFSRGLLIYDKGMLAVTVYNPKTEGKSVAAWLREVRRVCVYNVRTFQQLWQAPESDVGLPISYNNGRLDTLKIANITKCLEDKMTSPVVVITEINVGNGHEIRRAILSITRLEALDILGDFLEQNMLLQPILSGQLQVFIFTDYFGKIISGMVQNCGQRELDKFLLTFGKSSHTSVIKTDIWMSRSDLKMYFLKLLWR